MLFEAHLASDALGTLGYYRSEATAGKGVLAIDDEGRRTGFVEKPADHRGSACVNAGLSALTPRVVQLIRPVPMDFGLDVWPVALASGQLRRGFELEGRVFCDIGSPEALNTVQLALADGAFRW